MKSKTIVNNPYVIHIITDKKLGREFKGIAKCSLEDTFNEKVGEEIAKRKAEIRRDTYKRNKLSSDYNYISRMMDNELNQLKNRIDSLDNKIQERYNEIYSLTK